MGCGQNTHLELWRSAAVLRLLLLEAAWLLLLLAGGRGWGRHGWWRYEVPV